MNWPKSIYERNSGNYVNYKEHASSSAISIPSGSSDPRALIDIMGRTIPVDAKNPKVVVQYKPES